MTPRPAPNPDNSTAPPLSTDKQRAGAPTPKGYPMTALPQTSDTEVDERVAYTAGLRQLADILDAHPDLPLPWAGSEYQPFSLGVWMTKDEMAAWARALPAPLGKSFTDSNGGIMYLRGRLGGVRVELYAGRDEVCERIVVGTETVTEDVLDEDALKAVPMVTRTREVEQVEWRCHPILDEQVTS